MHAASSLTRVEEVRGWRSAASAPAIPAVEGEPFPLALNAEANPPDTIEDVIQRRGSTRRFARKAMPFTDLSAIIDRATRGFTADFLQSDRHSLNDIYAIVNRVDGLPPGAYFYRGNERVLD